MSQGLEKVLDQLETLTRRGRAPWHESGRPAEFVLPIKAGVLVLSKNPFTELLSGSSPGPFKLAVLTDGGTELAKLEARHGEAFYTRLKDLFDVAQQQARRVDDVIGDVEKELAQL